MNKSKTLPSIPSTAPVMAVVPTGIPMSSRHLHQANIVSDMQAVKIALLADGWDTEQIDALVARIVPPMPTPSVVSVSPSPTITVGRAVVVPAGDGPTKSAKKPTATKAAPKKRRQPVVRRRWSEAEVAEVRSRYAAGESLEAIAKVIGCSPTQVGGQVSFHRMLRG